MVRKSLRDLYVGYKWGYNWLQGVISPAVKEALPEDPLRLVGKFPQRPTPRAALLESYFTKLGVFTATEMVRLANGRLTIVDGDHPSYNTVRKPVCVRIVEWSQHAAGRARWAEVGGPERVSVWCPRTTDCPTIMSGPWMTSPYKRN